MHTNRYSLAAGWHHFSPAALLYEPHDGKGGNEIRARNSLFQEIDQGALPLPERHEKEKAGYRRPDYIEKLAEERNDIGGRTDQVHDDAKDEGGLT